ncbi:putative metal-binding motif-containing protein, partial [Nanoarchaeota archaeon]
MVNDLGLNKIMLIGVIALITVLVSTIGILIPGGISGKVVADCGNGLCESGEDYSTCPQDCLPVSVCENDICELDENTATCPQDCFDGNGYPSAEIESMVKYDFTDDYLVVNLQNVFAEVVFFEIKIVNYADGVLDWTLDFETTNLDQCEVYTDVFMGLNTVEVYCDSPITGDAQIRIGIDPKNYGIANIIFESVETDPFYELETFGGLVRIRAPVVCGDYVCEEHENVQNCIVDCDTCGNGICGPNENTESCLVDCPPCTDLDGDGYGVGEELECPNEGEDCDDADQNVNPGAEEVCNMIDDDCDGTVDNNCPLADKNGAIELIDELIQQYCIGKEKHECKYLKKTKSYILKSLNPNYWIDFENLNPEKGKENGKYVFYNEYKAVSKCHSLRKKVPECMEVIQLLTNADKYLAEHSLGQAMSTIV